MNALLRVLREVESLFFFFFQAEDGIRDLTVTGVQTCALPISSRRPSPSRFNPSTAAPIASPGKSDTQGATRSRSRPSATIAPHDGVGGCAPSPDRKSVV